MRGCRGAGFFTFFPGSSRWAGMCVGVGVSLGEGDPAGTFAETHPFWDFRPGVELLLETGMPISGARSAQSCRFAVSGEDATPLPTLFLG